MQKYHLIGHYMLIKCIDIDYFGYELVFSTYSCLNINISITLHTVQVNGTPHLSARVL